MSSSDESDAGPQHKRRRKNRTLRDSPSSTSDGSPIIGNSSNLRRRPLPSSMPIVDSDSSDDSGSPILCRHKKKILRVSSGSDSDSSDYVIFRRNAGPRRLETDSEGDGGIGSTSSQYESDIYDSERGALVQPHASGAKPSQVNDVESDFSDGQSEKCPICLVSFKTQEIGTPESCDHTFCLECIQEWSKNMNTCPIDRQEYRLILVRETLEGKVTKQIPIAVPSPQMEIDIFEDPTYCEICGSCDNEDRMLLCDGCDLGFHLYCLTPRMEEVPLGTWYCNDCSPDDVYNSEIELYEVHLLLDDAESMDRPQGSRQRHSSSRLIPRTRQSERVRRRIQNIRQQNSRVGNQDHQSSSPQTNQLSVSVTSTTSTRRPTKKRKSTKIKKSARKTEYKIVYELDKVTGETVAVEKRKKKSTRRKARRNQSRGNRPRVQPKTVKKRLAQQLGICTPRSVPQNLPDVKISNPPNNIGGMRHQAGIPTLHLFGQNNDLDYFSGDDEDYSPGSQLLARRAPNRSDISAIRRTMRRKTMVTLPETVSSSTDLLDSILSSQEQFHSRNASFSVDSSGRFKIENTPSSTKKYIDINKEQASAKETPYYNNNRNYNNSNRYYNNRNQNNRYNNRQSNNYYSNNQNSNYYHSEPSSSMGYSDNRGRGEDNNYPQDYTQRTLCASSDTDNQYQEAEDRDENNPAGTSKPNSESELDIYSDIETVSTSKAEENYMRPPSPPIISNTFNAPNMCTDEDNNDSEPDMVIDDEKIQDHDNVEDKREETAVTSTADYSNDVEPPAGFYEGNYSTEIQSGAVQSSNLDYIKNYGYEDDEEDDDGCPNSNIYSKEAMKSNNTEEDVDSDEGCPNFSIYSKESKSVAMHTDISMPMDNMAVLSADHQVGEISSSPVVTNIATQQTDNQTQGSALYEPECTFDPEQTYDPENYDQDDEGDNYRPEEKGGAKNVSNADGNFNVSNYNLEESDGRGTHFNPDETSEGGTNYNPEETYDPAKCFDEDESCEGKESYDGNKSYDPEQTYDPEKLYEENSNSEKICDEETSNPEKGYDPENCYDPEREISDENSQEETIETNNTGDKYDPSIPFDGDIHESDSEHVVKKSAEQYQEAVDAFNKEYRKSGDVAIETNNESNEVLEEGELERSNVDDEVPHAKVEVSKPKIKGGILGGLYSDSEDETVVRKNKGKSAISDINQMTEDISEEERSYTPCLDEKSQRAGLEGLDTEMISDEERNDFDESHELKTVSDGDALEINAKESELDFTRPEDYEEGEIVDKNKDKATEEEEPEPEIEVEIETESPKKKEEIKEVKKPKKKDKEKSSGDKDKDKSGNKENIGTNKEQTFKKLSKNTKERNYRKDDKDKDKEKEREKRQPSPGGRRSKDREQNKKEKRREKRKEIERYNVRALIAEKPRPLIAKDQFGRDIRDTPSRSRSRSYTPPIQRSLSRDRSASKSRRSVSRRRKSVSKEREKSRKRRPRSRTQRHLSKSRSRSISPTKKRGGSKTKKRKRSSSRYRKRKTGDRSRTKKRPRTRSRHRSRTPSALRRQQDWEAIDWTPMSQGIEQPLNNMSPSWTPPRVMDNSQVLRNEHLTVTLNNPSKKKKDKRRKSDKRSKNTLENRQKKRRHERERTPPPSKEVFASGDNILVSVSFNNENETRDITTRDKRRSDEATKKKNKERRKNRKDLSGVKPVAIIDLERSPFREITPSPKQVIVLSDSDNEENENMNVQEGICDSSQQVASPERTINYSMGPKTPPEPQVKFTLSTKAPQVRAINNPLHDPDEIETNDQVEEELSSRMSPGGHKGPNTPPEPPTSPPSSPDAYDPFEPTKSRSPTPDPMDISILGLNSDEPRVNIDSRNAIELLEKSMNPMPEISSKSLTPPLADVQPADSQSSIQATPDSNVDKSPDRITLQTTQQPSVTASKPVAQTTPFSSVPTPMVTSTPVSSNLAPTRINILNSTIIPSTVASSIPQRIVLPNQVKSSPVKISPTKAAIKSTPIKPMPSKTKFTTRKKIQSNIVDEVILDLDSPYSPGSSDYEDLFEPPSEIVTKPVIKSKSKAPQKHQSTFDTLFGSPIYKVKSKTRWGKKATPTKTKMVGVKLDEDNLKILDELPNSAVEMQVKDKFLKKLNRQERVVEEVKLVLKPHYNKKRISKEEYKDILRRSVPKICHNKSGEINPTKIKNLIEAYVRKLRHSKKVTSSSSVNPLKV